MKVVTIFILVILSAILGGIYGALYDQITYSISPEFFSKFRFPLYHFNASSGRLAASLVGFLVTWKVGLILGLVLSLAGLINKERKILFKYTLQSFLITLFVTFLVGMIGWSVSPLEGQGLPDPDLKIQDVAAFQTVINMNNFSYAGAVIGMFVGIFYQVYKHSRIKMKQQSAEIAKG